LKGWGTIQPALRSPIGLKKYFLQKRNFLRLNEKFFAFSARAQRVRNRCDPMESSQNRFGRENELASFAAFILHDRMSESTSDSF
jgi:hypothetical protein